MALEYPKNYGPYASLASAPHIPVVINTLELNEDNYDEHFFSVLNILRDGIELPEVQNQMRIQVMFSDGVVLRLSVFDYWFNLIFWTIPIETKQPVSSKYLFFFEAGITKKAIKAYIDNLFVRSFRTKIDFMRMNNIIDDTMHKLKYINEFAMYLANTVNFKDTLDLMRMYPEFNQSVHADLSDVPMEDVKARGMEYANLQIRYIKNSNHCLRDSFIAQEAINPKQFKEVQANIGPKPNGTGGIFPYIINNSFINGGVSDPQSYIIESSVGRTAQILSKMNVGTSGAFARLLEINNIDTFFHPDPDYSCKTKNYQEVTIKDATWLKIYDARYYKLVKDGPTYLVDAKRDTHLIGKTLLFRSPMTCASFAHGDGICRKCYGDLYYTVRNINPGKIAAELLSSIYTQMLLSAKHLLESVIVKMEWTEGFEQLFSVNMNTIALIEDQDYTNYYMIINSEDITSADDDDETEYNEYISGFTIKYPDGNTVNFHTSNNDDMFITDDLNIVLKSKKAKFEDGYYIVPLQALKDLPIVFYFHIQNKELSRTLEKSKHIINKAAETSKYDRNSILTEFITTNIEGNINLNAVHMEVIIANQLRDKDNILEKPNWEVENCPYTILTLGSSLTNNPSITVTLEYQKHAASLVSPLSMKKRKPSRTDVFFMLQPQNYLSNTHGMVSDAYKMRDEQDNDIMKPALVFYDENGNEIG